jgi:hypothetical protein
VRIAGVRLSDGRLVWLDAGVHDIQPLDLVTAQLAAGEAEGLVYVTPEALVSPPPHIEGLVIDCRPRARSDQDCNKLPGAEFPALGESVRSGDIAGTVIALDPVNQRMTIGHGDGETSVVSLDTLADE